MKEIEKLKKGECYQVFDDEISAIHSRALNLLEQFEKTSANDAKERDRILRRLFGSAGKNLSVKPGFKCDMGINIHVGDNFLTNYNVIILDMATVTIGNNCWLGPNAGLFAVAHPMEAAGRIKSLGIAKPITLGDNVWIGGNAVVLMGVTIGNNAVIGAGSVVNKNVPDNALFVGNPAKLIRFIDNQ